MMISKVGRYCLVLLSISSMPIISRDCILEFKGAYFLATGSRFKKMYKGGALYGPELTVQLCDDSNWYGFASVDYLSRKGHSLGLRLPTKISLVPIAFGLKYFVSDCTCFENVDFYVGLAFQPVRVEIKNYSHYVIPEQTQWALGGIAKVGAYVDLPCNFVLDLFVDYSFVKLKSHANQGPSGPVVPLKASVSGAIFGGGIGYRF